MFRIGIVSLLLMACSSDFDSHTNNLLLVEEEILHLIAEEPLTLGRNMGITPVSPTEDRFLVKNLNNSYVNVFGRDGSHLYRFGEPGRGPEEIDRIITTGFDSKSNALIWDSGQDKLMVFDDEGTFIREEEAFISKGVWIREHLFHYTGEGWIVPMELPGAHDWEERESVAVFDEDFNLLKTGGGWDLFYKDSDDIFQFPILTYDPGLRQTWIVYRTSPGIRILDESLEELKRLANNSPNFKKAERDVLINYTMQERQEALSETSLVMQPYLTDRYFLFSFINQTMEAFQTRESEDTSIYIALYSRENYDYEGEVELPGRLTGVIENKLMVLLDDDPDNFTIGIYSIARNE